MSEDGGILAADVEDFIDALDAWLTVRQSGSRESQRRCKELLVESLLRCLWEVQQ